MRLLPVETEHKGHKMRQIKRSDVAAIYSKSAGYEVFLIQKHYGYEIKGVKIEASEYMPKDEDFGTKGWYYIGPNARELAEKKWRNLNENIDNASE
jgi:hypothetical protein